MGYLNRLKNNTPPDANVEWVKQLRIVSNAPGTGRLEMPDGEIIKSHDPRLRRGGLLAVSIAGWDYYEKDVQKADCGAGTPASLLREPKNEHDPNAVMAAGRAGIKGLGLAKVGYVPADEAKRLAPRMDGGECIRAVFLRSPGPGDLPSHGLSMVIGREDIIASLERF